MNFDTLETWRTSHPAWTLLTARHAPLIASFLHRAFIQRNTRQIPESELARLLDDDLFQLRRASPDAYPRAAKAYLDDWSSDAAGWLRKRYIAGRDEAEFDITPATESALTWLVGLAERTFIGTESRLRTVFDLLRDLIHDTEPDVSARRRELERRRAAIDAEIARLDAGDVPQLEDAAVRDRFYLIVETASSLLSDFRAVEHNFRNLDRDARVQISKWEGRKGELLERILGDRDAIAASDQGRSFKAFYDLLMSSDRQDELTRLLERMLALEAITKLKPDRRIKRVHFDWLTAAEATQRTVAKLSSELRRYLDGKTFLENQRIMRILHSIEANAVELSQSPPAGELMALDDMAPEIVLPLDRPLFAPPHQPEIADAPPADDIEDISADALFDIVHVDKERLRAQIWRVLQRADQTALAAVIAEHPLEQGLAELVTYMTLATEEFDSTVDETVRDIVTWVDDDGTARRARMPNIVFVRRMQSQQEQP
jgi:Protein of unknown function (DUF3375)